MKYCNHCGNTLKPEARFCGNCGQLVQGMPQNDLPRKSDQSSCPVCSNPIAAGSRFCKSCGNPLVSAAAGTGNFRPAATTVQQVSNVKRKRRWVRVLFTLFLMVPGVVVLFYFLGTFEKQPDDVSVVPEPVTATESLTDTLSEYAVTTIEDVAETTEQVFLQADTAGLARILAPTTLARQRAHFTALQPHMKAFGEDFTSRKVLYANELYAVYEFECSRGKFTVDFCLGEDGTWKLMRF